MDPTVQQSDALGGSGSIDSSLQSLAVNGLSRALDGYLSTKYPLTSLNDTYAYNGAQGVGDPNGYLTPSSAPQRNFGPTQAAVPFLKNPVVWAVGGGVLIAILAVVVLRK